MTPSETPPPRRDLRPLFDPHSIAVVGASDDPVKWGNWLAVRALRGEHRRAVHLVNRRAATVLGRPAHASLTALPQPVELVVLAVPASGLEEGMRDAIDAGARAVVAISASAGGGAGDAVVAALAREAGVALLGPNCLGVADAEAELELSSNDLPRGPIGLVSQSGNLSLEIGAFAARAGLGFSRFASLGNQADLQAADLVAALAAHEPTRLIAAYVEDFRDGRAFVAAAEAARQAGKPVVLLAAEHSDATARAVQSHTGALASDAATIDAACRAAGIVRVRSPRELVDVAEALLHVPPMAGRRVAVLADGGGHGGVATGLAVAAGLEVPQLSAALTETLSAGLPPSAAVANPIDLAGGGEQDIRSFARTADALLASGEVDALLVSGYFGGYHEYSAEMAAAELEVAADLAAVARRHRRPLLVHSMHAEQPAALALRRGSVPVHDAIERTTATLATLAAAGGDAAVPELTLPDPAPALEDHGYAASRTLLAAAGVPFPAARVVRGEAAALAAAREIGYPVAVKALGLLHKSDAGGVVLGVADAQALAATVADLEARLAPEALSVEAMAPLHDGVELIAGARWDARFGPVVLVGAGGVLAETLDDTSLALAPIDAAGAERLLRSLRGSALLDGVRGRPPLDVAAAAEAIAAISRVAAEHPDLAELEVNPLLVLPDGALALDARVVPARETAR